MKAKVIEFIERLLSKVSIVSIILLFPFYLLLSICVCCGPSVLLPIRFSIVASIGVILACVSFVSFIILVLFFDDNNENSSYDKYTVIKKDELAELERTIKIQRKELLTFNKIVHKNKRW